MLDEMKSRTKASGLLTWLAQDLGGKVVRARVAANVAVQVARRGGRDEAPENRNSD